MVRVISLEAALAQGETHASIMTTVEWHRAAIVDLERRGKRSPAAKGKASHAAALKRHNDTITALLALAGQLRSQPAAIAA